MNGSRFTIKLLTLLSGAALLMPLPAPDERVRFTDVTAAAGIRFVHNAGRTGKKWLPETMGAGVALFDADGDGWLAILFVNGKDGTPRGRRTTAALYRNNHDGTFTDITRRSRLDTQLHSLPPPIA